MPSLSAARIPVVVVLSACLPLRLLSQIPAVQSGIAPPAVKIDGRTDDWALAKSVRDIKSGAEFVFQNDGRYLFVLFTVRSPKALASVESTGLTVLVRTAGAARSERGVLFLRRTAPSDAFILWQESQGGLMTEAEKAKLKEQARYDLCLTFAVGAGGSVYGPLRRLRESEPPAFFISESPDATVYELKIPLAPPDLVPGGIGVPPGETVRIAFEWGGAARKVLSSKTIRQTPPSEEGGLLGVATPAQEFLNMFDSLSRPTMGTKKFSFAIDVGLAEAK